jgi:hypothetical protein
LYPPEVRKIAMLKNHIRFTFSPYVPLREVEGTLKLAELAAQSLHGPERVELEAPCESDRGQRSVIISTNTEVGRTLASIFLGYCRREFGYDAVQMERMDAGATEVTR